jgi:Mg2+-importing ATPase
MRVVAVAWRLVGVAERDFSTRDEKDLVLAGFIAFLDPPKASAGGAIKALNEHGVRVKIITGDNPIIAAMVCREVGLEPGDIILGNEIEDMSDDELGLYAEDTKVFAKMNPLQKARVVRVLRARGHTVGYLGDGINDAVALRDADVGISVDTAVDVAKESADIILLEKSLMVLGEGVLQGRVVFGNIVKYIKMTTSSNFGNVFSVVVASAFIPFLPMAALQLMIQNLLYDLSQLSLPWDNMDKEFVRRPRKWDAPGLARFMVLIGAISSVFDITTFGLLWYVFGANSATHQSLFQSGWFIEGLLSQTLIVHMIRTQKIPFIQSMAAAPVLLLTGAIMVIGVAIPFTHFGASIGLQPLPMAFFPWLAATLLSYCVVTQFVKLWYIRRFKTWL